MPKVSRSALQTILKTSMGHVKYAFHINQVVYLFKDGGIIAPLLMSYGEKEMILHRMPKPNQAYEVE